MESVPSAKARGMADFIGTTCIRSAPSPKARGVDVTEVWELPGEFTWMGSVTLPKARIGGRLKCDRHGSFCEDFMYGICSPPKGQWGG